MKADLFDQRRLLELQAVDTALTQLEQRRRRLEDDPVITQTRQRIQALGDRAAGLDADLSDLDRDIERIEREIDLVSKRASADRDRMASGSATPKELEGLQSELESLARRKSSLEDDELEHMERRETVAGHLAVVQTEITEAEQTIAAAEADLAEQLGDVEAELVDARQRRADLTVSIPDRLVELYERIHARQPIAAAELVGRRCGSCRLEKSPADMAPIKAAPIDEVLRCEECGCVLIRTELPSSGGGSSASEDELRRYST